MPRPRLSECERQVPTSDIATVCCFWCGQRGHFWKDKFENKRCTNQPKLAAAGGGGAVPQREQEKEDKHGQHSNAQRDSIPQLAENKKRAEEKTLTENAKNSESKEKALQPRSAWAQNERGDQKQLQKLEDVKETKALEAAQIKILALEQKFTEAQLKVTVMEKERGYAEEIGGVAKLSREHTETTAAAR